MKIVFDPAKSARNTSLRGLPFERVADFGWSDAVILADTRHAYPETRYVAVGYLDGRLPVLCFTPLEGAIRVISFRKANAREAKRHDKPQTLD